MNKRDRRKLIDTDNKLMVARGKGGWGGLDGKEEGIKKYK